MAASLNILFRGEMHTYHAAADTTYNALGPNTFMYFDHLRWAGANGFKTFDFGRCKRGTGVFDFKRHWNTTMRELPYELVLVEAKVRSGDPVVAVGAVVAHQDSRTENDTVIPLAYGWIADAHTGQSYLAARLPICNLSRSTSRLGQA